MNFSIWGFVIHFIIYIVIHTGIGYKFEKVKKELEEKPGNDELMKTGKRLKKLFKWFPAIYVVWLLLLFYFF